MAFRSCRQPRPFLRSENVGDRNKALAVGHEVRDAYPSDREIDRASKVIARPTPVPLETGGICAESAGNATDRHTRGEARGRRLSCPVISAAVIALSRLKATVMWPPPVLAKNVAGGSKAYSTQTPPPDKSWSRSRWPRSRRPENSQRRVVNVQVDRQHRGLRAARNRENAGQCENARQCELVATPIFIIHLP